MLGYHTKMQNHTYTQMCKQNTEFLKVKGAGIYSYHCSLQDYQRKFSLKFEMCCKESLKFPMLQRDCFTFFSCVSSSFLSSLSHISYPPPSTSLLPPLYSFSSSYFLLPFFQMVSQASRGSHSSSAFILEE